VGDGEEGGGGEEGKGRDRMGEGGRRRGKEGNYRVPTTATDHSRGGAPPSRSPRLTVMWGLRERERERRERATPSVTH